MHRTDAGGASLAGRSNMINALARLGGKSPAALPDQLAAFGISGRAGISALFRTHPAIDDRIARLRRDS